ncbi:hypothetical protein F5888DRAFT_1633581 [Russula emetica]|nr:hypothetical protein F5888DRAFT_1633581 [Russula emetica]
MATTSTCDRGQAALSPVSQHALQSFRKAAEPSNLGPCWKKRAQGSSALDARREQGGRSPLYLRWMMSTTIADVPSRYGPVPLCIYQLRYCSVTLACVNLACIASSDDGVSAVAPQLGVEVRAPYDDSLITCNNNKMFTPKCSPPRPAAVQCVWDHMRVSSSDKRETARCAIIICCHAPTTMTILYSRSGQPVAYYARIKVQRSAGYVANSNVPDLRPPSRIDLAIFTQGACNRPPVLRGSYCTRASMVFPACESRWGATDDASDVRVVPNSVP